MPKCDRCHKDTSITTMSMFNTQIICMLCRDRETKDPRYEAAKAAEAAAVRSDNLNFKGIGW